MKPDKMVNMSGLEQLREWFEKEHWYCSTCLEEFLKKARSLIAEEKAATEKAQLTNPVVAAPNETQGPLRAAIWELVEEMEANIEDGSIYSTDAKDLMGSLKEALEKGEK